MEYADDVRVEKRDGRTVAFDRDKITTAIASAYGDLGRRVGPEEDQIIRGVADRVEAGCRSRHDGPVKIADVQTLVEQSLVSAHQYDVAKAYTDYRLQRDISRAKATDVNEAVSRLVNRDESLVRENANKDSNVYATQRDLLAGAVSKASAFEMLPPAVSNAHMKGQIHFHDSDYSPFTAQSNCFAAETRFVTSEGVRAFADCKDGDRVTVLAPSGAWREATIHEYGVQPLCRIVLSRRNLAAQTVFATRNHRWLLEDGSVTDALAPGMRLAATPAHRWSNDETHDMERLRAWCMGYAYSDSHHAAVSYVPDASHPCRKIVLDDDRYAQRFRNAGFEVDGTVVRLPLNPWNQRVEDLDVDRLSDFFDGYVCADGIRLVAGQMHLLTSDRDDLVERYSAVAGFYITSMASWSNGCCLYGFLPENDDDAWTVSSVDDTARTETVWCLDVPEEHAFTLANGIVTGNCSLPDYFGMMSGGFTLANAPMSSPKSIMIAATQITQIMKDVASSQYGGQTANRADEHFADYARLDYEKFLDKARTLMPDDLPVEFLERQVDGAYKAQRADLHFEKDRADLPMDEPFDKETEGTPEGYRQVWAKIQTRKAIYDAMQTMEYQINSNRVSNGQTPFVTIGFGLGTDWFSREITRAIFLNRIRGLGITHQTAIFPKLVYTIRHGVNADPGDPNYDLKQLALECSTKRMYPDIVFYENIINITGSFKAPMGCVTGSEIVTWRDKDGEHTTGIARMWNTLTVQGVKPQANGTDEYIDLKGVTICDSHHGMREYVDCLRMIRNHEQAVVRIQFTNGHTLTATLDHPLEVLGKGRIPVANLQTGDQVPAADGVHTAHTVTSITPIPGTTTVYDVTTESDYFDVSGIVSHNCRSFLQGWTNPETGEDEEEGRMNLGVVTVNIPRIALESHGDEQRFWNLFEERMEVAHQALQFRIMRCKQAQPINAPSLYLYGGFGRLRPSDDVDQLFRDGRATISLGYIGLAETVAVFKGKDWIKDHEWDESGRQFALSIVHRMADLCRQWEKEEGYHYSVYSTPAESLTDRFSRLDRAKFGRVPGVTDHDFYTNSFHYPVWLQPTPFEKLKYEVDFPYYSRGGGCSGGFIMYTEEPMLTGNPKALEAIWDYAYDIGVGYLGTNTPIDHCYLCGFEGDFTPTENGFKCPECGNSDPLKCNVTKRTCGYLGNPVQRPMVHGRHEEIAHRVKHASGTTGHVTLENGADKEWFEKTR